MEKDRRYEYLFTVDPGKDALNPRWMDGVARQRTRTTKAGDLLLIDSYPVYTSAAMREAREVAVRRAGLTTTSKAQRKVNADRAERTLSALMNANFGTDDLLVSLTCDEDHLPENPADMQKAVKNYLRRISRLREKRHLDPLKYIYTIEISASGRLHAHLVMNQGISRDEVEALWDRGFANTKRAQQSRSRLSAWAGYMTKVDRDNGKGQQVPTAKRWYASRNLKKPVTTRADKKLSRHRVEVIAREVEDHSAARAIFEKLYPGYELVEVKSRASEWLPGAYISVQMVRKEGEAHEAVCVQTPGTAGHQRGATA